MDFVPEPPNGVRDFDIIHHVLMNCIKNTRPECDPNRLPLWECESKIDSPPYRSLPLSLHFHFGIGIFSPSEREKSLARKLAQNPAERGSPARSLYREVYDAAAPECELDKNAKAEWNRERKRGNKFLCQVWNGSGRKKQGCPLVRSYVSRPTAAPPRSTLNFR